MDVLKHWVEEIAKTHDRMVVLRNPPIGVAIAKIEDVHSLYFDSSYSEANDFERIVCIVKNETSDEEALNFAKRLIIEERMEESKTPFRLQELVDNPEIARYIGKEGVDAIIKKVNTFNQDDQRALTLRKKKDKEAIKKLLELVSE